MSFLRSLAKNPGNRICAVCRSIAFALLVSPLLLTGCQDDVDVSVRNIITKAGGVQAGHDVMLERAMTGDGAEIYRFYRFLLAYVPIEPSTEFADWPYKTDSDKLGLLNCAAEVGVVRARREARYAGIDNEEVQSCLNSEGLRKLDSWNKCGVDKLLPACPLF